MSTRPRPKPRMKTAAKPPAKDGVSSNASRYAAVPEKLAAIEGKPAKKTTNQSKDEDWFMKRKKDDFVAQTVERAKQEKEAAKNSGPIVVDDSDDDNDDNDEPTRDKRDRRAMQENGIPALRLAPLPAWTQSPHKVAAVFATTRKSDSASDSDVQVVDSDEAPSPRTKRAHQVELQGDDATQRGRRKDKVPRKSKSPSISPPPPVPSHQLINARIVLRQQLQRPLARSVSPEWQDISFEGGISSLNPELQQLAQKMRQSPALTNDAPSGRPEKIDVRVRYVFHPNQMNSAILGEKKWLFKMRRTDDLKIVFNAVAQHMNIPIERLKMCYKGKEVFKAVSPDSFSDIWNEAEFEAYLDTTLAYIRAHRLDSPPKSRPPRANPHEPPTPSRPTTSQRGHEGDNDGEGDDDDDDDDDDGRLVLGLQSGAHQKVTVTTRKTTTAMSLLKYYMAKVGMPMNEEEIEEKNIRLAFDGEAIGYEDTVADIADGELEGEECLDVLGI
ncbi:hypothetical protein FRB99_001732 [Tulasnella sp. 403]|nr:hypothetical protein FRB99_001732 [Tulasnella sp. 403]